MGLLEIFSISISKSLGQVSDCKFFTLRTRSGISRNSLLLNFRSSPEVDCAVLNMSAPLIKKIDDAQMSRSFSTLLNVINPAFMRVSFVRYKDQVPILYGGRHSM